MEAKLKNVEIAVGMCKKVSDIAVVVGIPYNADKICLNKLRSNNICDTKIAAESSALAFALYETIRDKMIGSPLEVSRSKVSRISCDAIGGKTLVMFNCQGSFSALRKNVGLVLASLTPHKLFSKYSENMKLLGGKVDRNVFNHCANELSDAIKKSVKFAVVGKIKVDNAKLKELLGAVMKKHGELTHEKGSSKPETHKHEEIYPTITAAGITAAAVADYVLSKSGGMNVDVLGSKIVVYNKSWASKQAVLKNPTRIKDYVRQKYEKLDKDFHLVFAYLSITQNLIDCCAATTLIKTKPTPSSMVGLIQKAL